MKRLVVLAVLALGLSVAAPAASPAGGSDAQGPPCANITNGDGSYSSAGLVDFTVYLQSPACSFVTYSFFVTDTSGNLLGSSSTPDSNCTPETTDSGCVHFTIALAETAPSTVCVYAKTEIHGHLVDLAPNASDPSCPASSPSRSLGKGSGGASGGFF
jgi:hypothetical protein